MSALFDIVLHNAARKKECNHRGHIRGDCCSTSVIIPSACQYSSLRLSGFLAEDSASTIVLLNPRKALALCACGKVAVPLVAHESMKAKRHKS